MARSTAVFADGFTLIELMAAMAVGAIVLMVAAQMLGKAGGDYSRISGGVETEREMRAALGQIESDAATARPVAGQVFETRTDRWPSHRIGFLCLQPPAAQSDKGRVGDLCAVNYYLKDLRVGGRVVRCLMRGFRESGETFAMLRAGGSLAGLFAESARDEPVAFGVVAFEAGPVKRAADGSWQPWKAPEKSRQDAGAPAADGPEALRVRLVVATREMMGKLQTPDDWDGKGEAGQRLGPPGEASRNPGLRTGEILAGFGPR
jgi:prepilin-type N-terminal cleavage/methylation domain-containing protein